VFDRKQVLDDLSLEKKQAMPTTTVNAHKSAYSNFDNFTKEKYSESGIDPLLRSYQKRLTFV